jgi:hypothetical protein
MVSNMILENVSFHSQDQFHVFILLQEMQGQQSIPSIELLKTLVLKQTLKRNNPSG